MSQDPEGGQKDCGLCIAGIPRRRDDPASDPVMCSCGREFDTPQALWDHYVKDGASDWERESRGDRREQEQDRSASL